MAHRTRVRPSAVHVLLTVVAVSAGACAGAGGGGAAGSPGASPAVRPPPAVAVLTQVLTFQAFDDKGLLPDLVRIAAVSGQCTGGSVDAAGRADAWHCTGDGRVLDPCFSTEAGGELACVADPFTHEVTMLQIPGRLPRGNRNDPGHPPWFLELDDGLRCGPGVGDPVPRYACGGGVEVAGSPDGTSPVWTVQLRPAAAAGSTGSTGSTGPVAAGVRVAWY